MRDLQLALMRHQQDVIAETRRAWEMLEPVRDEIRGKLDRMLFQEVSQLVGKVGRSDVVGMRLAHQQLQGHGRFQGVVAQIQTLAHLRGAEVVIRRQEEFFGSELRTRAAIYDRHTNPAVSIAVGVTDGDREHLRHLPLQGRTVDEWMQWHALGLASDLRATASMSFVGSPSTDAQRFVGLDGRLDAVFGRWMAGVGDVARCALAAAGAVASIQITEAFGEVRVVA